MPDIRPDPTIFDSRDLRYKSPYGAVAAGTQVTFSLRPLHSDGYTHAHLSAYLEFWNEHHIEIDLPLAGIEDDRDVFTGVLDTGDYVGLVWYSLSLFGPNGRYRNLGSYQLTVYDGSEAVPDWFGQGMCYQIFPDRFHRTSIPDPTGMVGGRWVHDDWEDRPAFRPNEHGEIRNRDFFGGSIPGGRYR